MLVFLFRNLLQTVTKYCDFLLPHSIVFRCITLASNFKITDPYSSDFFSEPIQAIFIFFSIEYLNYKKRRYGKLEQNRFKFY